VYILEDGSVVLEGLLARLFEHFAHVFCLDISKRPLDVTVNLPQPYAMCAIWLLGTMLPLAFLTILGDANDAALSATAVLSMMPTTDVESRLWIVPST
jgi:hypothetical protein